MKKLQPDIAALAETLPCILYRFDLVRGAFLFLSDAAAEITGYPAEMFLTENMKWMDLVFPEDQKRILQIFTLGSKLTSFSVEYRIKHASGMYRWVNHSGVTVKDKNKIKWGDGIIQDITTKKEIAFKLDTKIIELQNLVNHLDDIIFELDSEGRFIKYYAKDWHKLILPPGAFMDKTIAHAFAEFPELSSLFTNTYAITIASNTNQEIEFSHLANGIDQWFIARFINLELAGSVLILVKDITKRKNTELELLRSEQFLRWSSETAKIGGWEIDLQKRTSRWSEETYKIHELNPSQDSPLFSALNYYPTEVRPIVKKAITAGIEKGIPWDLELPFITSTGNKKWVREIGVPQIINGKCHSLRGVLQDITSLKQTEDNLHKSKAAYEVAVKGAELGTWDWNLETDMVIYNQQWASMLGFELNEINPHLSFWENLVHPQDLKNVKALIQKHLDGETELYETEYRLWNRNGHWIWVIEKGRVIEHTANGKPYRATGINIDISGRKETELKNLHLQFELKEFQTAISHATILSITDKKGIIKYANENFEEISQFKKHELIGNRHNIINSGFHSTLFWKEMWKTISKGHVWRDEVKNKRKDGTYYWVDTFIIPIKDNDYQITEYLSIRNDITEKKENELKLQLALEKSEESDRLKASFLSNISHEIRTPMNAIMGFAELMNRTNLSELNRINYAKMIYDRSTDLLNLLNNILEISKIEAGQVAESKIEGNIKELLEHLLEIFKAEVSHLHKSNVTVTINNKISSSHSLIVADFIRLKQVINNLLNNAAKFTKEGSIEIGCHLNHPEFFEFWVRDTGIGIPKDKLEAIFLPFCQADKSIHQYYGGSGLGLAISKALVELWGGKIWVESEENKGSTFYFTLPIISEY